MTHLLNKTKPSTHHLLELFTGISATDVTFIKWYQPTLLKISKIGAIKLKSTGWPKNMTVSNVVFHNFFCCLIPRRVIINIILQSKYSKLIIKIKNILVKDEINELNCKKCLISNTVYGRRHLKQFMFCGTPCNFILNNARGRNVFLCSY